jgi:hypothetical protein
MSQQAVRVSVVSLVATDYLVVFFEFVSISPPPPNFVKRDGPQNISFMGQARRWLCCRDNRCFDG